ncbi:MAG: hypothetical protein IT426_17390 [Pirellulales bacterium]|nr:hypothetical protein [Pirellulales bacterium]
MNSRECILAALRREAPAWIPTFEWLVDRRVREALCPGGDELDFVVRAGWDAVVVYADDHPDTDGKTQYVDEWGLTVRRATEEYPVVVGHRFDRAEDLDSFTPPDPLAEWHFRSLCKAVKRFGGEKAIVFRLRDAYSLPRYLVGMENLMMLMAGEPEFVRKLIGIAVDYYVAMARRAAALGADVFWTSDDYCDNRGPVMGPQRWRSLCLPGLQRLIRELKPLGKPFIKHCDGNVNPILDDLVRAGIDCIDPIDANAGVELADVKARFGGRVAIKGGVPVKLLCDGDPRQVRECVKACIETAGPEGYILSSTSDITASVKPENYAAMLDAWREYR